MIIFFLFIPFAIQILPWFEWSDGCEHAAAIRELNYSLLNPRNPLLDLPGDTSPRYVPSIVIMAILQKIFIRDIFNLFRISSIVAFLFLGLGIYLFAKEYFQDEDQPVYTLLSILFLWGRGWDGANSIQFSSLVYNAYYPSSISYILVFFALTAALKYLRQNMLRYSIAFIVLSSLIFLDHQPTGFLFFFITALLIFAEGYLNKRHLILFLLSIVIAVLITSCWPYYSFIKGFLFMLGGKGKQFWDYQYGHHVHYSGLFDRIGPCFLGIITVAYFAIKRQYPFIFLGFIASFVFYVLGYLLKIILFERLIFLCLFFSQLAFSRMLKNILYERPNFIKNKRNSILKFVYVTALVAGVFIQFYIIGMFYMPQYIELQPQVHIKPYQNPLKQYISLTHYLNRGDTVITDVFTSWVLPCVTNVKVISLYHNSPFILENPERLQDTMLFFTSTRERSSILGKYGITHILINKTKKPSQKENFESTFFIPNPDQKLMDELATLGKVVLENDNFFLVALRSS
jgi:hypothetical protein